MALKPSWAFQSATTSAGAASAREHGTASIKAAIETARRFVAQRSRRNVFVLVVVVLVLVLALARKSRKTETQDKGRDKPELAPNSNMA